MMPPMTGKDPNAPRKRGLRAAAALLVLALALPVACAKRVPLYSPRLEDNADHRAAKKPSQCLECHEAASLPPDHSKDDRCQQCHKLIPGVPR